jgi:hypothetical protein
MDEIFPWLGGVVLGLAASQLGPRLRWVLIAAMTMVLAFAASRISGELDLDWRFLLLDAAEVLLAASAALALTLLARRSRQAGARENHS